ncbi:MAG TPA: hypothetical protein DCS07_11980 [Bdellovibrionales bacterium]|nr:MAG: hypothetical protein A2Z97_16745 [Bdellovibrionales bacterium GWB1_52_6]OFZ03400.1 MAG: hypothetical protein A2X97_05495 [Bdellovibrionales bacterium GWA1_52_35]OFZ40264.1 MAG: hypothetical protein A2070_06915 [Bdellovibrionales bacterium GWC1_52_8]HAR43328.1 hypothetical protein [Bdellovibrionales bacterium]HCM40983.1 hypothetical protein [Bdellovibrionales bacterium]
MKNFMKALLISGSIAALANIAGAYAAEKVGQSSDKAACQGTQVGKVPLRRALPVEATGNAGEGASKASSAKDEASPKQAPTPLPTP